jgi:uncharacterized membrane protein HdeD (DUF308 family)
MVASNILSAGAKDSPLRLLARRWWLLLVTGLAWVLFSIIVFRFNYTTVAAVSILFGFVVVAIAANEILLAALTYDSWRAFHILITAVFAITAVLIFVRPGNTFGALATLVSFVLIFRGVFDITAAFMAMNLMRGWWVQIITGVAELLIGFWAAASWQVSARLLVTWVGVGALLRGIGGIIVAFQVRHVARSTRA